MSRVLELLKENEQKDLLRFITAGSVDDGKSTLIGRLLYESNCIFEDQLASVQKASGGLGSAHEDMDLSLVTDGLKAEREQGITIDVAYRYFATPKRKFIVADTPGHEQYTRNMATGASTASLMVILIDAQQGVLPQSKRHAFIASLLGIRHVVVTVNKMDLVDYSQDVYEQIRGEFSAYAAKLDVRDLTFIPVSALVGDNVVHHSPNMPWYEGTTLMNYLQTVHIASDRNLIDLRFPVQLVQRLDANTRAYLGTVASGVLRVGAEVLILPTGTRSTVARLIGPDGDLEEAFNPLACGVVLDSQVDVSRGNMIVHSRNVPHIANSFETMVVWMSEEPMVAGRNYLLKHSTRTVGASVATLRYRMDIETLRSHEADTLQLNEIGRAVVDVNQPLAFDPYTTNRATGGFVLIDRVTHNTVAAGMILPRDPNELVDTGEHHVDRVTAEHVRSHVSAISTDERVERLGHKAATVWLTGLIGSGKTATAYALEKHLFEAGVTCCVLNGANMRLGVSKGLSFSAEDRYEQARRAAELARLLNDAGQVVICDFTSPYAKDRAAACDIIGPEQFLEVHVAAPLDVCRRRASDIYELADKGEVKLVPGVTAPYESPAEPAVRLESDQQPVDECVQQIMAALRKRGVIS
ncbi:MAG: sulfate adenylyltransferase subunit CysN [Planctomycetota bacterium]|jgi:bifunctional enzyme CysN/CysC